MKTIKVKKLTIGTGRPKICVPIVGTTLSEILSQARDLSMLPADLAEWRIDWFAEASELDPILDAAQKLRSCLPQLPLLFTFRTAAEGGMRPAALDRYEEMYQKIIQSKLADFIDVEAYLDPELASRLISEAHKHGCLVIASNHDFEKTPPKEELLRRLRFMQELDADLPKIAVTPQNRADVLTLLEATLEMNERYADRPIITMSMGSLGSVSRLIGEFFGSAITFGSAARASAPGQIEIHALASELELVHKSLEPVIPADYPYS